MALNPKLKVIAPWREWEIRSREDAIKYATKYNIPLAQTEKDIYSRDRNIMHLSHEGGLLENPWNEPESSMFQLSVSPEEAPDQPEYIEIGFEKGNPISLNGETLWSRAAEGRFPDAKELKQRLRDRIAPDRDLGHVDH